MESVSRRESWAGAVARREDLEGFRVRSRDGHLGFVDAVRRDVDTGEPTSLVVRAGRIIVLVVPYETIEEVVLERELVMVGGDVSRLVGDSLEVAA
ncbi:MAG: hypothetical protein U0R69_09585 [Gaiellales bacterium]